MKKFVFEVQDNIIRKPKVLAVNVDEAREKLEDCDIKDEWEHGDLDIPIAEFIDEEEQMIDITDVGQLIDIGIVNFIGYMKRFSFSETVSTVKMLEMELGRTSILKDNIYEGMSNLVDDPEEHDRLSREFIQTYVVEQKIQSRIDIGKDFARRKGVL